MEAVFNKLQSNKNNTMENLIKWMKEAKLIDKAKGEAEEQARKLFKQHAPNPKNVALDAFKKIVTKLAADQKKPVEQFTSKLLSTGPALLKMSEDHQLEVGDAATQSLVDTANSPEATANCPEATAHTPEVPGHSNEIEAYTAEGTPHSQDEEAHRSGEEPNSAEEEHNSAEEEHNSAAKEHNSSEEHNSAEEEHNSAEEHNFAEEEHNSSEEEHNSAEKEHNSAEEENNPEEEEEQVIKLNDK